MTVEDGLRADEGWRAFVYDDATGQPITKGYTVKGYPTIGYGFCIDPIKGRPLSKEIGNLWLAEVIAEVSKALADRWPHFLSQPEDVRSALVSMAFNMGVEGLLQFKLMLAALAIHDREAAATQALNSLWANQVPARAKRTADLIRGHSEDTTPDV